MLRHPRPWVFTAMTGKTPFLVNASLGNYAGMPERYTASRDAFRESVLQLVDVVERVPPTVWEKPGLGELTVRELVAHVMRGVEGPAVHSGQPKAVNMDGAATYYLRAMSPLIIHEDVAERARQSTAMPGEIAVSQDDGTMLAMAQTGR